MKKNLLSFILLLISTLSFGQSVLIQPNGNNGILSQNSNAVVYPNPDPTNTYAPPTSGAGTRLMWIPNKSAFRVGTATGTQWNANKIGTWSFASGSANIASGEYSTAMGESTTASGIVSFATGSGSLASGNTATAIGLGTTASGDFSTAMGFSSKAIGENSSAIGLYATSQAYSSIAVGSCNDPVSTTVASATTFIPTDPIFIIGNGHISDFDGIVNSNAMMVLKNGNVGLGTNTPNATLEVKISDNNSANKAIYTSNFGSGDAIIGTALGTGRGASFVINNATSSAQTCYAATLGTGQAGYFKILNTANTNPALVGLTDGSGSAIFGTTTGTGKAGNFTINNVTNSSSALTVSTNGSGRGIDASTTSGIAGYFSSSSGYSLITGTGNVGIGTAIPTEKLEVTGNIRSSNLAGTGIRNVSADANGTLTIAAPTPQTNTIAVPPQAFRPRVSNSGTFTAYGSNGECFMAAASTDQILAPVFLPNGATITGATVYYIDTDASTKFVCSLITNVLASVTTNSIFAVTTSAVSGSSTSVLSANLSGSSTVVNNTTSSYFISIGVTGGTGTWLNNMSIKGVKITYTL